MIRRDTQTVLTGDCRDVLKTLPEPASLIIADPPYNIGADYGGTWNDSLTSGEYRHFTRDWIAAAYRALKPNGSLFVFINVENLPLLREISETVFPPFPVRQVLIWFYTFGQNTTTMYGKCFTPILWLVKDAKSFVFNADAVKVQSKRQQTGDPRAKDGGRVPMNVWEFPRLVKGHKNYVSWGHNQLPIELVERIVLGHSNPGDVVVDPFSGTGSTMIACKMHNRNGIGIELNPEYAELSRRRIVDIDKFSTKEAESARDG